jgi:hypothetical protein
MSVFRSRNVVRLVSVLALPLVVGLAGCKPEAPSAASAASSPSAPAGLVVPEKQQAEKLNAYVVAYNKLLQWHSFGKILREYQRANPKIAKAGAALDSYSFGGGDVDDALRAFDKAMAMTQPLPELDEPGKALKAALEAVNPLIKEARTYESTKEDLSDKGAKARQMDAPLVAALAAANKATAAFGTALSAQTLKRDEAELATLKPGTVGFHKLKVSLETRKLASAVKLALDDKQNVSGIDAALQAVSAANTELGTLRKDPKAAPAWDPVCAMYKDKIDSLIGGTRTLVSAMNDASGKGVPDAAKQWFDMRNKAVDASNSCGD